MTLLQICRDYYLLCQEATFLLVKSNTRHSPLHTIFSILFFIRFFLLKLLSALPRSTSPRFLAHPYLLLFYRGSSPAPPWPTNNVVVRGGRLVAPSSSASSASSTSSGTFTTDASFTS